MCIGINHSLALVANDEAFDFKHVGDYLRPGRERN
jgi:hypothetical protein